MKFRHLEIAMPRVSRKQAEVNRERVLDTAARSFKAHGYDGIGIADLMQRAGLTHGGFYAQFGSKAGLAAEATERALAASLERWKAIVERDGRRGAATIASRYLTRRHRDQCEEGCVLSSLAAEAARQGELVTTAFARSIDPMIDVLADGSPGRTPQTRRKRAVATLATIVGAMVLARATGTGQLSNEFLGVLADEATE
jgi:TetR/AcrR family transcriptional repressor of nem operon